MFVFSWLSLRDTFIFSVCVFLGISTGFTYFLFKDLNHLHLVLKLCWTNQPVLVGPIGSSVGIVSWLLLCFISGIKDLGLGVTISWEVKRG